MSEERRKYSDPLIQELVDEVRGFRKDMEPIRQFMDQVNAAKTAAIWIVGFVAAVGAAISWALNVKDKIGHK